MSRYVVVTVVVNRAQALWSRYGAMQLVMKNYADGASRADGNLSLPLGVLYAVFPDLLKGSASFTSVLRPGAALICCGLTNTNVRASSSSRLYTGRQKTPVDSMAIWVTAHSAS
jgi:hypothetical protein